MGGTTVWRPHVRQSLPGTHEIEVKVGANEQDGVKQGVKRKRAPRTKGPCEHGVKHARSARCAALVRTVVGAVSARSAVVHQYASTVVMRTQCKECGGSQSASTVVCALQCKECGGSGICEHGRQRSACKECGGASICEHGPSVRSHMQGVRWCINSVTLKASFDSAGSSHFGARV